MDFGGSAGLAAVGRAAGDDDGGRAQEPGRSADSPGARRSRTCSAGTSALGLVGDRLVLVRVEGLAGRVDLLQAVVRRGRALNCCSTSSTPPDQALHVGIGLPRRRRPPGRGCREREEVLQDPCRPQTAAAPPSRASPGGGSSRGRRPPAGSGRRCPRPPSWRLASGSPAGGWRGLAFGLGQEIVRFRIGRARQGFNWHVSAAHRVRIRYAKFSVSSKIVVADGREREAPRVGQQNVVAPRPTCPIGPASRRPPRPQARPPTTLQQPRLLARRRRAAARPAPRTTRRIRNSGQSAITPEVGAARTGVGSNSSHRMRPQRLGDVQLPGLAVEPHPSPVVHPEGGVGILLDLQDEVAGVDRVDLAALGPGSSRRRRPEIGARRASSVWSAIGPLEVRRG